MSSPGQLKPTTVKYLACCLMLRPSVMYAVRLEYAVDISNAFPFFSAQALCKKRKKKEVFPDMSVPRLQGFDKCSYSNLDLCCVVFIMAV